MFLKKLKGQEKNILDIFINLNFTKYYLLNILI